MRLKRAYKVPFQGAYDTVILLVPVTRAEKLGLAALARVIPEVRYVENRARVIRIQIKGSHSADEALQLMQAAWSNYQKMPRSERRRIQIGLPPPPPPLPYSRLSRGW